MNKLVATISTKKGVYKIFKDESSWQIKCNYYSEGSVTIMNLNFLLTEYSRSKIFETIELLDSTFDKWAITT